MDVHAVLISCEKPSDSPDRTFAALLTKFSRFVTGRFPSTRPEVLSQETASYRNVFGAISNLQAQPDDLLIILFIGHGRGSDRTEHPYQSWVLWDRELSDEDLAKALYGKPVRCILINCCCYGAGMGTVGHYWNRNALERVLNRLIRAGRWLRDGIRRRWRPVDAAASLKMWVGNVQREASGPRSLICISAAGADEETITMNYKVFIDLILDTSALPESTYGNLSDEFGKIYEAGKTFEVHARPGNAMCRLLFT